MVVWIKLGSHIPHPVSECVAVTAGALGRCALRLHGRAQRPVGISSLVLPQERRLGGSLLGGNFPCCGYRLRFLHLPQRLLGKHG